MLCFRKLTPKPVILHTTSSGRCIYIQNISLVHGIKFSLVKRASKMLVCTCDVHHQRGALWILLILIENEACGISVRNDMIHGIPPLADTLLSYIYWVTTGTENDGCHMMKAIQNSKTLKCINIIHKCSQMLCDNRHIPHFNATFHKLLASSL